MKRLLITLLLLISTPALAMEPIDFSRPLARMGVVGMSAGVAAAAKSCVVDSAVLVDALSTDEYYKAGGPTVGFTFAGQKNFTVASNTVLCSAVVGVRNVGGTATTWYLEVYTMSGTNLNALVDGCRSGSVSISSSGSKTFTWSTGCSLTASTNYGLVLVRTDHNYNSTDYLANGLYVSWESVENTAVPGDYSSWNADKTQAATDNRADISIQTYGYTP